MRRIEHLREKIDKLDREFLALLEKRIKLVNKIKSIKRQKNFAFEDKKRENQIIKKLISTKKVHPKLIKAIYTPIFKYSKNETRTISTRRRL